MTIGYAIESDAGAILGILAQTFPAEILGRTPLGCAGARQFIADTIGARKPGGDVVWVVARDPHVIGFVEMRVGPHELFLNHIHVIPSRQSQGIGRHLLRGGIELTRPPLARRISLGVFHDRERQIDWYARLSFAQVQTNTWLTINLNGWHPQEWFCLSELPQADCIHARYGFSQVVLKTTRGTYGIGRLDDRFFRVQGAAILEDPTALGALAEDGPDRQLVVTFPDHDREIASEFRSTHAVRSLHMSAAIDEVLSRLPRG